MRKFWERIKLTYVQAWAESQVGEPINLDWTPAGFVAYLDSYDGAPDAGYQPTGYGSTKVEALRDLVREVEDY